MNYWSCPPLWRGQTAFVVAGGPSLRGFDFAVLRHRRVIAINSSYLSLPDAEFLFFGDDRWATHHAAALSKFPGEMVTTATGAGVARVKRMKPFNPPPGIVVRPDSLSFRRTSLTAAMNLAYHLGVSRIVLLGADMQRAPDGVSHHHKAHPWPQVPGCWDEHMKDLAHTREDLLCLGVEVINTSMVSLIDFWPKQPIGELL